jgi:hypothetical protein
MAVRSFPLLAGLVLTAPALTATWTAVLAPTAGSKVSGSAVVETLGADSARATIRLSGAMPGSEIPWHIHSGACGAKGQILGNASGYPALKARQDGSANGTVTLPVAMPVSGEFTVTVHKSKTDMAPAACGTLKPQAAAPMPKDTTTRP